MYVSHVGFDRSSAGHSGPVRLPELSLAGAGEVPEGRAGQVTAARFTVRLSRPSRVPVTVRWSAARQVEEGDEQARDESTVVPRRTGRVTVRPGRTRLVLAVPVEGNDRYGKTVGIDASLTVARGAVLGANVAHGSVRDDDPPPRLTVGSAQAVEGSGVLRFPVRLSAPSDQFASVALLVADGSARRGSDWQVEGDPDSDPVVYGELRPGQARAVAEVVVVDDRTAEPTETVSLTVTEVYGATASGPPTVTGTILDDD